MTDQEYQYAVVRQSCIDDHVVYFRELILKDYEGGKPFSDHTTGWEGIRNWIDEVHDREITEEQAWEILSVIFDKIAVEYRSKGCDVEIKKNSTSYYYKVTF